MEKQNKQVNAIKHKGKKFSPAFQRWRKSGGRSHPVAVAAVENYVYLRNPFVRKFLNCAIQCLFYIFATHIVPTFIFRNHTFKAHLPHHTSARRHAMLTFKQNYARKYFGVSYCNAFSASVLCKTVIFASLSKKSCKNLLTNQIACAKIISLKQQCSYF